MEKFSDFMDKIDKSFITNSKILSLPIFIKDNEDENENNKDKELSSHGRENNTLSGE